MPLRLQNKVLSTIQPAKVMDDMIRSSSEEQKGEAIITSSFGCFKQLNFEMEFRIYDKAGNMSEPVTATFLCPALKNRISPFLIIGLILGVGLLGEWDTSSATVIQKLFAQLIRKMIELFYGPASVWRPWRAYW
jgi:hypothetical protein